MSGRLQAPGSRRLAGGFTLIELMIALLLGLLVMSAAIGIFLSNRQAYSATENLGRVQENVRFAFELMAHDIRRAGANPCGKHIPLVNTIAPASRNWWENISTDLVDDDLINPWRSTLLAYPAGLLVAGIPRVVSTDAIEIISAGEPVFSVQEHNPASNTFTLNSSDHDFTLGSIMVACDARQASVFRAAGVGANTVLHGGAGNCTANLGLPDDCATATTYTYQPNAVLARLDGVRWYVGENGRGSQSLYYTRVDANGAATTSEEVVEGVDGLGFEFLVEGADAYVPTSAMAGVDWGSVTAIRVNLGLTAADAAGSSSGNPVRRDLSHVVTLRNRNP